MHIQELFPLLSATDMCSQVPLITGKHGIGKSEAIKQFAKDNNLHCEVLILSLMDVADLCGIPRTASIGGQQSTVWSAPDWFSRIVNAAWGVELNISDLVFHDPEFESFVIGTSGTTITRDTLNSYYCNYIGISSDALELHTQSLVSWTKAKRSILFLDEFNRATLDTLQSSLQLILDKRLHSHILPVVDGKPTFIVAAINPSDSDYATQTLDPALLDRFVQIDLEPDSKSWLAWARSANVAPIVRDFIAEHPDRLHFSSKDGKTSATPRSWTSLGRTMSNIDKIDPSVHFDIMKGHIGSELASQFLAYFNNYFKVIKAEDVEAFIAKASKTTKDISKLSAKVTTFIKDQEVIQKQELIEQFYEKYMKVDNAADALPLIVLLSSVELETLSSFLKTKKDTDIETYLKLAKFDGELNGKNLFLSITSRTQK